MLHPIALMVIKFVQHWSFFCQFYIFNAHSPKLFSFDKLRMKRKHILSDGTVKVYEYNWKKYYKPRPKKTPKFKLIPKDQQEIIVRLHNLGIGTARISKFLRSNTTSPYYIGEHSLDKFLKAELLA